jgi:hypothetical protein
MATKLTNKLEEQLYIIISNDDIEELKKFFCNRYRVKTYINIALRYAAYNYNSDIISYIISNFNIYIKNYYISYALEKSINQYDLDNIKYIINNYKLASSKHRIYKKSVNYVLENIIHYNYLDANKDLIKSIITNHIDRIDNSTIYKLLKIIIINYKNITIIKYIVSIFKNLKKKISKQIMNDISSVALAYKNTDMYNYLNLYTLIIHNKVCPENINILLLV